MIFLKCIYGRYRWQLFAPLILVLLSCGKIESDGSGFSLPEGNAQQGRRDFVSLQCNSCHSLPDLARREDSGTGVSVRLGGEVRNIKTYGELVTAIVNPSHKILQGFAPQHKGEGGGSAMRNYNDVMTVTQLIDLVSFLQTQYQLKPFD
ncbi:MAG: hypothetical protein WBN40_09580, partial [Pseudomonadales bacterium]